MASNPSDQPKKKAGVWSIEGDAEIWRTFAHPRSDEEFCQAWLALLCRQLPGVKAGVVLLRSAEADTFGPAAVWPDVARDLSFLRNAAERALTEARGVVHRPDDSPDASIHVAYPIEVSQRTLGSVVLETAPQSDAEVHALLRQLHWGIAWLYDHLRRRELTETEGKVERIGSVMEVLATALQPNRLQQNLFDVANHVARYLRCSRVAIGLIKNNAVRLTALSSAAWFEKNAEIVKLYAAAMGEAYDRLAPVSHKHRAETGAAADSAHARLAGESGALEILSVPLQLGAECLGVLTLERNSNEAFDANDRTWVDALISLLPAVIDQKRRAERGYIAHARDGLRKLSMRLFGPKHLIWKFGATIALLLVALLALTEIDYRVSAKTVIEGETQRAAVAPYDGYLAVSYVRPGDVVHKGQILCALDDNELKLEQKQWEGEREQTIQKLREAMAKHDSAAFQAFTAKIQETEARLVLVEEQLARAQIAAPFDGVIISGDLSQLIGSPVEQGKKLFEIAPLESYRVILQVDEREVRHVQTGQTGKLIISGIAVESIPFSVSKVTPVATAQDGRNFFRVEANLEQAPQRLRPGMEGVGKITVGERRLWWVLTHSFTDWLRLSLWAWLP